MKKPLLVIILSITLYSCKTSTPITTSKQYEIEDSLHFQEWLQSIDSTILTIQKDTAWQ